MNEGTSIWQNVLDTCSKLFGTGTGRKARFELKKGRVFVLYIIKNW